MDVKRGVQANPFEPPLPTGLLLRIHVIGGQRSVRIVPPHHSDSAARDFLRKGSTAKPLDHFKGVRPTIKFTVEREEDRTLPFLDTLLRSREDGSLDVFIYRKPTHTDWYLHLESHHPTHVKRSVLRCLHDRAREIISTQDNLQKEVDLS